MSIPNPVAFTLLIDQSNVDRVAEAFASQFGYQPTVDDGAGGQMLNPMPQIEFARQRVMDYIRSIVIVYESNLAAENARQSAADAVRTQLVLS